MSPHVRTDDGGFGLIEVVIAMLLLAVIAMALLPALWDGIGRSSQQAATATATRELNSLIEGARISPDCTAFNVALQKVEDQVPFYEGGPREFIVRFSEVPTCAAKTLVPVKLEAVQHGTVLASVQAEVYVP